jgi:hypothetical protein
MRFMKTWLLTALLVTAMAGMASSARADYWRSHDGHWSYYHEGDKCWYYTDGTHWFCQDKGHWVLYKFDKLFGHKDFEMGDYKHPKDERKIELPHHEVFRR